WNTEGRWQAAIFVLIACLNHQYILLSLLCTHVLFIHITNHILLTEMQGTSCANPYIVLHLVYSTLSHRRFDVGPISYV
ncbi:hypothetical protein ACJX0J_005558, partial [Zea mays]